MAPFRNFLIYLLAVLVVGTGALTVYEGKAQSLLPSHHGQPQQSLASVLVPLPRPFPGIDRLRLMLIGADERKGDVGRSDTLMILQVNPTLGRATLLSLPRDLRVEIPGHGHNKINAAYAFGGPELSKQTVEQLLGIPLDGYVKVNIDGFVKAVDTLGGVDLTVEDVEGKGRGMNYDCPGDGLVIHMRPGPQHLTGYKAMGYVRYRHSNIPGCGGTDFQRGARQQKLLKALLVQKLRVTNIPALMKAGQEIFGCVKTTLSWRQMFDLMRLLRELKSGDMKSVTLDARDDVIRGVYYCAIDEQTLQTAMADAESFLSGVGGGDADAETAGPVRVDVRNGYVRAGEATKVADKLKKQGYEVISVGNATTRNYAKTVVLYRGEMQEKAQELADTLGGALLERDPSGPAPEGTAQVQVTIGKDYQAAPGTTGAAKSPAHAGKSRKHKGAAL